MKLKILIFMVALFSNRIFGKITLDNAISICTVQYAKDIEVTLNGLKGKYSPQTIKFCREYMQLSKDLLDISKKVNYLENNFLENKSLDYTATSWFRQNLENYKSCLVQLNNYQPTYQSGAIQISVDTACNQQYMKDQKKVLNTLRSSNNQQFMKMAKEFVDLIKLQNDKARRLAVLEATQLDIDLLSIIRQPLEQKYKDCLDQRVGFTL